MKLAISKIKVKDQVRKEFGDVEGLASSIKKFGLLHPLTVDDNDELVAGERRLRACKLLNFKEVEVKYKRDLSPLEKTELQLEENLMRKDLTWVEEVKGKWLIDVIKRGLYGSAVKGKAGGWGVKDTAMALGKSAGSISTDIQLAEALRMYPALALEKNKSIAFKKLKKLQEEPFLIEIHKRMLKTEPVENVILGDARVIIPTIKKKVHLIVADPPWGIEVEKSHGLGKMSGATPFRDDKESCQQLAKDVYPLLYNVLEDDTHAYIFFAITQRDFHVEALTNAGFWVDPIPIVWPKEAASAPGVYTRWTNSYETVLFCKKGNRKLNSSPRNVLDYKRVSPKDKIHDTEKPVPLIKKLITVSTLPGECVLDPFGGSGSTLEAAVQLKRDVIIIEKEKKYYHNICERARQLK